MMFHVINHSGVIGSLRIRSPLSKSKLLTHPLRFKPRYTPHLPTTKKNKRQHPPVVLLLFLLDEEDPTPFLIFFGLTNPQGGPKIGVFANPRDFFRVKPLRFFLILRPCRTSSFWGVERGRLAALKHVQRSVYPKNHWTLL